MNRKIAFVLPVAAVRTCLVNAVRVSLALAVVCLACPGKACQVPVFRYALERWEPAPYKAIVFHRGPLAAKDRGLVDSLDKAAQDPKQPANLEVQTVDLAGDCSQPLQDLHKKIAPPGLPFLVLLQPDPRQPLATRDEAAPVGTVAWSAPLETATADRLLDSPLRRELARRLLKGDSAVWVLLESGNRASDTAVGEVLATNLKKMQTELAPSLSAQSDGQNDDANPGPPSRVSAAVPLRVAFSVLNVSRSNAAEDVLLKMLLALGPEGKPPPAEPMLYVVFGRGRAIGPLIGKAIDADEIASACSFLVGDCSCFIKDDRPGNDLLMRVDWNGLLEEGLVDKALPPLTGVMPAAPPPQPVAAAIAAAPVSEPAAAAAGDGLVRNVAIALLAVLVIAAIGTVLIRRRSVEL